VGRGGGEKQSPNLGMKGWLSYLLRAQVVPIIPSAKANPNPRTIPYPNPWDNGGDDIGDTFFYSPRFNLRARKRRSEGGETKWNWVRGGYIIFLNFDLKIHEEPGSFFFCAMVRSNYPAAYAPSVAPLWHLTASV